MKTIYNKLLFLMLLLPVVVFAQSTVEGTVVDKVSKQPLPGVNVVIQGAANGTQTDFDGKFKLNKVKKGEKIVFSYVGYVNTTVTYDSQTDLSVSLLEESNQLQEVVIQVGYGSAKKKDATGSVALITAKDFNKGAIVSADQLLSGKAAGVRITTNGGQPDADPNIRIRGGASLNASNSPLIIIDGVPIGDSNPVGIKNPLSLVNPNDIESFSILKDASATAIYGVRASNGVILITTKKGTVGAPQFNYSANLSVGKLFRKMNVMEANDFVSFIRQYHPDRTNVLGIDDPSNELTDDLNTPEIEGRLLSDTDWQDVISRTSISTDHNFSARANLYKRIPFRASVGYSKIQGIVKTSDLERLTYSLKMTPKFWNDNLKIDVNAKGLYTDKNEIDEGGVFGDVAKMDPTKPVYGSSFNNKFVGYYQATILRENRDETTGAINPLARLEQRHEPVRSLRFLGNIEFDYKLPFLRDLRAVVNLGIDASESKRRTVFDDNALATYRFNKSATFVDLNNPEKNYLFSPGVDYQEQQTSTNKTMDAYLAYSKNLTGFVTKVDAQAGYSYQDFVTDGTKNEYQYNPETGARELFVKYPRENPTNRYYSPLNLQAFFARTNVDLLGRYLFTATLRADGSSLFQENKRWGYFPAFGLAWKLKEESFLKNMNFVQDLKLRLGWGQTGQANIPGKFFPSRQLYEPGDATSQYLPNATTYTPIPYNPDLTWETTTTLNAGLDFEIFKRSIVTGSFDVYQRNTTDLLAETPGAAGGTGGTLFLNNVGSIKGEGFELDLKVKVVENDNLSFSIGGNIGYSFYRIDQLDTPAPLQTGGIPTGTGVPLFFNAVGQQAYSAWVFQQVYDSNGNPIVGAYVDTNQDGEIGNDDRVYKGIRPNWVYGFNTNFSYKNWDLSAAFRGQLGGQVYNADKLRYGSIQSAVNPQDASFVNNVLNFNDGSANPLFDNYALNNSAISDYMLEDATFLRCDNIALSYNFQKIVKNASMRVSGSVNNVFILTKYSGQDPETFGAFEANFYPRPTTFTLGLSLDF
jgi:iron complex outermembrane receptor protein